MSWFSNKKEAQGISDMPELPELPDSPNTNLILPSVKSQASFLPPSGQKIVQDYAPYAIPDNYANNEAYSEKFKPIINEPKPGMQRSKFSPSDSSLPELPERPVENFRVSEIKEPRYEPPEDSGISKAPGYFKPAAKNFMKKDESVYIKLEKFQLTMEAFREIKNKIREIEDILAKTREIRAREEKELEEWEREIEAIKLKLGSIDREISNSGNY